MAGIKQRIGQALAGRHFARRAIEDQADLSAFGQRPGPRFYLGLALTGLSMVIGWPAIALLGGLALYFRQPYILIIGGPVAFVAAHLAFAAGVYLAGGRYTMVLLRWAVRKALSPYHQPAAAQEPNEE